MRSPTCHRSRWSVCRTAARSHGGSGPCPARNSARVGRWPRRHSSCNCSAGSSWLIAGLLGVLRQAEVAADAGQGALELLAAPLGGAAHLGGDLGPLAALAAQVG